MSFEQMAMMLKGKVALITGASSGIGWATALAFAAQEANTVVVARREQRLSALSEEIRRHGAECAVLAGDASLPATAAAAVQLAIRRFGAVDFLVHCAGIGKYKSLIDTSIDEYDEMMASNMRSTFLFCREVAPHFVSSRLGTIVLVSSVAGLTGAGKEAVYSSTKFAQMGFAQSLDEELREYGVKVCALCPGGTKTEFAVGHGRTTDGVSGSNMMEASEIADAILFCCMQPSNVRIPLMTVRHMGRKL